MEFAGMARVRRYHSTVSRSSFKTRFCEWYGCQDTEYEERAFRKCLYLHARCLAPLVRLLNGSFFNQDFKLVRDLGETTGRRDANSEVLSFQELNRARPSFLRTSLQIRASGRKANALAGKLFGREPD
jgi:hypothetical protein